MLGAKKLPNMVAVSTALRGKLGCCLKRSIFSQKKDKFMIEQNISAKRFNVKIINRDNGELYIKIRLIFPETNEDNLNLIEFNKVSSTETEMSFAVTLPK